MEEETHQAAGGGSDEQQICRRHHGKFWRCKKVSGDNNLHYCENHYKNFKGFLSDNLRTSNKNKHPKEKKKMKEMKEKKPEKKEMKLLPDEERCCVTNRVTTGKTVSWRCKNFRMSHGSKRTKYCEKHYNSRSKYYQNLKKRSGDGTEGEGCSPIQTRDSNCSKRRKKVAEEDDGPLDVTGIQPAAADRIVGGGSAYIGRTGENVEITEGCGELEPLTGIRETVVELESLEHYKTKCFELSVELEKRKLECNKLQGKLLGVVETRKIFEDAAEYWRKMYSDLESRVLRVENENSTMRCFFSNLESIVPRNGKESSTLRCSELRNSEEMESEAWGLPNEVTQSGERHHTSNHNAETSSGGRKDSHVFELKTKENVLNVLGVGINKHYELESEFHNYSDVNISSGSLHLSSGSEKVDEGKGWGCLEERPSQDRLEMSTKAFVNLDSDDRGENLGEFEDSDSSGSLGTLMYMMAMKYRNRNEDREIKWKFEADMLSSLEEEPELCMKAVCALYRQHISEDEKSDKGLFHNSDVLRCNTLAKFLMGCEGDLNKSVKELETFDSKAVEDCKRLARRYSTQLFSIYQNGKEPFFPSSYNC